MEKEIIPVPSQEIIGPLVVITRLRLHDASKRQEFEKLAREIHAQTMLAEGIRESKIHRDSSEYYTQTNWDNTEVMKNFVKNNPTHRFAMTRAREFGDTSALRLPGNKLLNWKEIKQRFEEKDLEKESAMNYLPIPQGQTHLPAGR